MTDERAVTLLDGTPGIVRSIRPSDKAALADALDSLSHESRVRRFFFDKNKLGGEELRQLTNPDGIQRIAYGLAVKLDGGTEETPIAVARCVRDEQEKDLAEIAIVTADEWQGNGAGVELMRSLTDAAVKVGIRRWLAAMFSDNTAIHRLLRRFGRKCAEQDLGDGVVEVVYEIVKPSEGFFRA